MSLLLQELPLGANTTAGTVPGATDTSGNTYLITSNKLTSSGAGDTPWASNKVLLLDEGSTCANQLVEIEWVGSSHVYAVLRFQSSGNCYLAGAGGPALFIVKCVSGGFDVRQNFALTRNTSLPEKIEAQIEGSLITLRYYSDGVLIEEISVTDVTYTGASQFGLCKTGGSEALISSVKSYDLEGVAIPDGQVLFDGNSLTSGGWGEGAGNNYPAQTLALLGDSWIGQNFGFSGQTTLDMLGDVETSIDVLFDEDLPRNVVVAWEGRNHIVEGATAQQAIDSMIEYVEGRKTVGFEVFVITITASAYGDEPVGFNAAATFFNDYWSENWATHCDGIIPLHLNEHIGFGVNPSGSDYFEDGVHLSDLGYAIVADAVRDAILNGTLPTVVSATVQASGTQTRIVGTIGFGDAGVAGDFAFTPTRAISAVALDDGEIVLTHAAIYEDEILTLTGTGDGYTAFSELEVVNNSTAVFNPGGELTEEQMIQVHDYFITQGWLPLRVTG